MRLRLRLLWILVCAALLVPVCVVLVRSAHVPSELGSARGDYYLVDDDYVSIQPLRRTRNDVFDREVPGPDGNVWYTNGNANIALSWFDPTKLIVLPGRDGRYGVHLRFLEHRKEDARSWSQHHRGEYVGIFLRQRLMLAELLEYDMVGGIRIPVSSDLNEAKEEKDRILCEGYRLGRTP